MGWPVDHSRSPHLHNAVHTMMGLDAHYHRLPTPPSRLAATVTALAGLGWRGVNVTIPHKVEVMALCDEVTDEASVVGAVNLLTFEDSRVLGDNTDARGYVASLRSETPFDGGGRALVVGTGGAARAVVVGLAREGVELTVAGRNPDAVAALVDAARHRGAPAAGVDLADLVALGVAVANVEVVVNATSLGMSGESLPSPLHALQAGQIASDVVYAPRVTPFLESAGARGATVHPGEGMLLAQAALSFARWHGGEPPLRQFAAAAAGH